MDPALIAVVESLTVLAEMLDLLRIKSTYFRSSCVAYILERRKENVTTIRDVLR